MHFQHNNFENTLDIQVNTIKKYLIIILEIKQAFQERFIQFKSFKTTFRFNLYP